MCRVTRMPLTTRSPSASAVIRRLPSPSTSTSPCGGSIIRSICATSRAMSIRSSGSMCGNSGCVSVQYSPCALPSRSAAFSDDTRTHVTSAPACCCVCTETPSPMPPGRTVRSIAKSVL